MIVLNDNFLNAEFKSAITLLHGTQIESPTIWNPRLLLKLEAWNATYFQNKERIRLDEIFCSIFFTNKIL